MSTILFYLRMVTWMFFFIIVMSLLVGCQNFKFKADVEGSRDDTPVTKDVMIANGGGNAVEARREPLQLSDVF